MGTIVELRLDGVPGASGPPHRFLAGVFRQRITALNHEALDHAMKTGAVVKSLFGERFEILDRLGRDFRPEFNHHLAFGRLDHGHFFGVAFGRFGFLIVLLFSFFLVGLAEGDCQAKRKNHHATEPEFLHRLGVPRSCGVVTLRFFERQLHDARQTLAFGSAQCQFRADPIVLATNVSEGDIGPQCR